MNKAKELLFKMLYPKNDYDANPTDDELIEAITELEVLQQRSCQNCKHWKVRSTLVASNECFRFSGRVMTHKDFCCNIYEPKEQ